MDSNDEFDPKLIEKLRILQAEGSRNPEKIAAGRAAFLRKSTEIAKNVSPDENLRHKNWKQKNIPVLMNRRKERSPMFTAFTSILLAVGLLLGGSGVTVAAAQSSQPGDLLYEIKLLSEDTLMDLTANPESQFNLALDLVDRRANEIVNLLLEGEIPTDETGERYYNQIEQAINLALDLSDGETIQAFEQIQTRLHTQEQLLLRTQTNGSEDAIMAVTQTRQMIQERVELLEIGKNNLLDQIGQQGQSVGTGMDIGNSPNDESGSEAPALGENNPWITEAPGQNAEYGPGDQFGSETAGTPSPEGGYGPGPGEGSSSTTPPADGLHGGGSMRTPTPSSGQGSGSGTPGTQNGNH